MQATEKKREKKNEMLRRHTERDIGNIVYSCQQIWFFIERRFSSPFGLFISDIDHLIAHSFCKNLFFYLINLDLCKKGMVASFGRHSQERS